VQILGLCPLLAVSSSAVNGLGLGLATLLALVLTNTIVSAIRHLIRPDIRIPVFVLLIASIVTAIELTIHAFFSELHAALGIFIPLIVTNCSVLGRAEAFASKNSVGRSFVDGFSMGLGFAIALTLLGAMRELLGTGMLFDHADLMFGEGARALRLVVIDDYKGFLLAILPPGAFIGLGLLIALKNLIDNGLERRAAASAGAASTVEMAGSPG